MWSQQTSPSSLNKSQHQHKAVGGLFGTVGRGETPISLWVRLGFKKSYGKVACTDFTEETETVPLNFLDHSPVRLSRTQAQIHASTRWI